MWCVPFISKRWHLFIRSQIIFVEARTHFDVLLLELKLKAIQYKSSSLSYHEMRSAKMLSSLVLSLFFIPPPFLSLAHCIRILFLLSLLLCFISFYFIFYSCIYLSQTVVLCCRYIRSPVRILFYFILYSTHFCTLYFLDTHVFIYLLKWYRNKWIWIFTYTHSPANGDNSESIQPWLMNKWQMVNWKSFFLAWHKYLYIYILYGKKEIS